MPTPTTFPTGPLWVIGIVCCLLQEPGDRCTLLIKINPDTWIIPGWTMPVPYIRWNIFAENGICFSLCDGVAIIVP